MPETQKPEPLNSANSQEPKAAFKETILGAAIQAGILDEESVVAGFVDSMGVADTIRSLHRAFPANFQHTFAAKANAMRSALLIIKNQGMGCEVSSRVELEQAINVGFIAADIVYDEPAKTKSVIAKVLDNGIGLNVDNFQEFELISSIIRESGSESRIGFRINPQIGVGSIESMSTATKSSKFGIAIDDEGSRSKLLECYSDSPWLQSIHTHIGSQGCTLELMVSGIRKVVDLALEINEAAGYRQISTIDIGGGLPVNFDDEEVRPTFSDYASILETRIPELFSGVFMVKTEFGRSIIAKSGFIASRVEYTKNAGGRRIAIAHAGAQVAARTVFMPQEWPIRLSVVDKSGRIKSGDPIAQDIAGPCCFAGDMIGRQRMLPVIEPGDYVVLHDTGAYYFSNPFFYNSLPACAVYGASTNSAGGVEFDVWRKQQSLDETLALLGQ